MRRIAVYLSVAAAILVGILFIFSFPGRNRSKGDEVRAVDKVARGPLSITVLVKGQIAAKKTEKIRHNVERQLKIVQLVEEGTRVEKGQVLVRFDTAELEQQLRQSEAELKNAIVAEEIAQKEMEILKRENVNSLRQAEIKLKEAEQEREKHLYGDLPRTERQMDLKIEEAESQLKRRKESYGAIRDPELIAQGFVTPLQIEEERIAMRSAEINLELARSGLQLFRKYTRPTALAAKRVAMDTARANLDKTKTVNDNRVKQKQADLSRKKEHVNRQRKNCEKTRENIAGCVLKAPKAGLVMYGEQQMGWRHDVNDDIRVGGTIYRNLVIMTLPDLDNLIVRAQIGEVDITKVREGMRALVTSDAYPDLKVTGKVSKIGNMPIRNWYSSTQSFEVEIDLPQGGLDLRPNVSARAEILVRELKGVLHIAISAVFNRDGRNLVYVGPSGIEAREVELGHATDTRVEIRSGLEEDEEVLLYEPEGIKLPKPQRMPEG